MLEVGGYPLDERTVEEGGEEEGTPSRGSSTSQTLWKRRCGGFKELIKVQCGMTRSG